MALPVRQRFRFPKGEGLRRQLGRGGPRGRGRRLASRGRHAGRARSRLGVVPLSGPVARGRGRRPRWGALGRFLGFLLGDGGAQDGWPPAEAHRARKCRGRADLEEGRGFRGHRRRSSASRLSLWRADDRRRRFPSPIASARFLRRASARFRAPARLSRQSRRRRITPPARSGASPGACRLRWLPTGSGGVCPPRRTPI